MLDEDILDKARHLVDQGKEEEASKLLWPLSESRDPVTKINAIFVLIVILNPITDIDKLVALADNGIEIAGQLGLGDERAYLLSRKVYYLLNSLSMIVYRAKNLTLFGRVYKWLDFSLERDKEEYAEIMKRQKTIRKEIIETAARTESLAEECNEKAVRGRLFESIGDYYSTWFFLDCLDRQRGGRIWAKTFNLRLVRRWNLVYFLYDRDSRRILMELKRKCFHYLEKSIEVFEAEDLPADVARAAYNLSTKLMLTNHFRRAQRMLLKAKLHVDKSDTRLVNQISELEQRIKERNSVTPNYVDALGLDMP